ncbi:MAG: hypothetical protein AAF222_14255, partial [Pseudomonadota bacterium]
MKRGTVLVAVALAVVQGAAAETTFVDAAGALPREHVYRGDWEHFVGGGLAVFDCNGDQRPDLFVAGGTS